MSGTRPARSPRSKPKDRDVPEPADASPRTSSRGTAAASKAPKPAPKAATRRGAGSAEPAAASPAAKKPGRADPAPGGNPSPVAPVRKAPLMTAEQVRGFIEALAAENPTPETELAYVDPFTLLVAVVLSAQATDASVNKASETLFKAAPTPAAMIKLGVEGVASHIRSIGLWQTKARNVVQLARELEEKHHGQVPHDREALEALPGVGRKTANVVLNVAFGESTMAVDTHIFRLGNRTGIAPGKTPREVEDGLLQRIPPDLLRYAHHWLILHGRYVCKARRPECWHCRAATWCQYPDKNQTPIG